VLNVAAAIAYIALGWASGLLTHVTTDQAGFFSLFSSNDSVQYRAVANWIFGAAPEPAVAVARPFLFPLMLGSAQRVGGLTGIWLMNVALWFVTLNLTALATYRFVKSHWVASAVFLALALNASLIVLTFKALTEITAVALLAIWTYGLTYFKPQPTPGQVAWVVLPVALLVVVRPQFEFLFLVAAVACAIGVIRGPTRGMGLVVLAACTIPIAIQVGLMVHFNGYVGISSVGDSTLRGYYLARLELAIGGSKDLADARLKTQAMSNADAARFVVGHAAAAVRVFVATIIENLLAISSFVRGHQRLKQFMQATQLVYFAMLIATIVLGVVALWRRHDIRLALLGAAILNILVTAGLTFGQGDRITVIMVPVLLVSFVAAIAQLRGTPATSS
jgi:hypothetical protein